MTDAPFFDLLAMSEFTAIEKGTRRCAYARAKSFQSRPTLCDPMECSLPGSSVLEILQAKKLEWVAMPSSTGSSRPRD